MLRAASAPDSSCAEFDSLTSLSLTVTVAMPRLNRSGPLDGCGCDPTASGSHLVKSRSDQVGCASHEVGSALDKVRCASDKTRSASDKVGSASDPMGFRRHTMGCRPHSMGSGRYSMGSGGDLLIRPRSPSVVAKRIQIEPAVLDLVHREPARPIVSRIAFAGRDIDLLLFYLTRAQ